MTKTSFMDTIARRDRITRLRRKALARAISVAVGTGPDAKVAEGHGAEVFEFIPELREGIALCHPVDGFVHVRVPDGFKACVTFSGQDHTGTFAELRLIPIDQDWGALHRYHFPLPDAVFDEAPESFTVGIGELEDYLSPNHLHSHTGAHESSSSVGGAADTPQPTEEEPSGVRQMRPKAASVALWERALRPAADRQSSVHEFSSSVGGVVGASEPTEGETSPIRHWIEEGSYDGFPKPVPFYTAWCSGPAGTLMLNAGHHWKDRDVAQAFIDEAHTCVQGAD